MLRVDKGWRVMNGDCMTLFGHFKWKAVSNSHVCKMAFWYWYIILLWKCREQIRTEIRFRGFHDRSDTSPRFTWDEAQRLPVVTQRHFLVITRGHQGRKFPTDMKQQMCLREQEWECVRQSVCVSVWKPGQVQTSRRV